jgi:hypothetical protein
MLKAYTMLILTEMLLKPHLFDAVAISIIAPPERTPRVSSLWGTIISQWATIG